jgi:hypothetical protein
VPEAALSIRPLSGAFGAAEIEGLHPEDADDRAKRAVLLDVLARHAVVCVRCSAPLDDAQARAIASMIGPIKDPVGRARDGTLLRHGEDRQIIDAGFVLTDELRADPRVAPRSCRGARAAVRTRVAAARRAHLGQRLGAAQGERRLPDREPRRFWRYMIEGPVPVAHTGRRLHDTIA